MSATREGMLRLLAAVDALPARHDCDFGFAGCFDHPRWTVLPMDPAGWHGRRWGVIPPRRLAPVESFDTQPEAMTYATERARADQLAALIEQRRNLRHNAVGLLRARDRLIEERDALAARLAAVEDLAEWWETHPVLDGRPVAREVIEGLVHQLRAALAAPTDTTKEAP